MSEAVGVPTVAAEVSRCFRSSCAAGRVLALITYQLSLFDYWPGGRRGAGGGEGAIKWWEAPHSSGK